MKSYLSEIKSEDHLRNLFIERWNWDHPRISSVYFDFSDELNPKIDKCSILSQKADYKILFIALKNIEKTERQIRSFERKLITQPGLKNNAENSILIFSVSDFEFLDFVKPEKIGPTIRIKRFSINPDNREKIRTSSEQLEILKLHPDDSPSLTGKITHQGTTHQGTVLFCPEDLPKYKRKVEDLTKLSGTVLDN